MKKLHLLFICLATLSTIYSCKKDDVTATVGSSDPVVDNSEKITGELISRYFYLDTTYMGGSDPIISQDAEASFIRTVQEGKLVLADTVYMNRIGLKELTPDNYHAENNGTVPELNMVDSCSWEVFDTSNTDIPSFKYRFTAPFPSILGRVPDTIIRDNGFKLNIQIAGADSIVMGLGGDSSNNDGFIVKTFAPSLNNYFFTANEIKTVRPSTQILTRQQFVIVAYKRTIQEFEGKYMRFTKMYTYHGAIWVKKE